MELSISSSIAYGTARKAFGESNLADNRFIDTALNELLAPVGLELSQLQCPCPLARASRSVRDLAPIGAGGTGKVYRARDTS